MHEFSELAGALNLEKSGSEGKWIWGKIGENSYGYLVADYPLVVQSFFIPAGLFLRSNC